MPDQAPAGRCIRLIRPHRWGLWHEIKMSFPSGSQWRIGPPVQVTRQERVCLRCGRIEIDEVCR